MPTLGKAAARTALPQPPRTSQNVPMNSAPYFFIFSGSSFARGLSCATLLQGNGGKRKEILGSVVVVPFDVRQALACRSSATKLKFVGHYFETARENTHRMRQPPSIRVVTR